jgi:hypothetical protein
MTANREDLAGRPRGGRHGLLTTRAGTFSALHARRWVHAFPSLSSRPAAPRADRIVSSGHLPFALSWPLSRERTRFARAPLGRASRRRRRPSGATLLLSRFPRRPGTPLRECRASLSRSSGGPAASETSALPKERLPTKGQES